MINKIIWSVISTFTVSTALFGAVKLYPAEINDVLVRDAEGGRLLQPNSGFGKIVIVNRQKRVETYHFIRVFEKANEEYFHVDFDILDNDPKTYPSIKVIDASGENGLILYPEKGQAIVDVAALAKDTPSPQKLAERTRKEMLRAFVWLAGAGIVEPAGTLMDIMCDYSRLDAAKESVPMELSQHFPAYLERSGVKPWQKTTYRDACQEGWAPQPTNNVQKAIWDHIYTPPTKPIKITYDKDKQKPVVK